MDETIAIFPAAMPKKNDKLASLIGITSLAAKMALNNLSLPAWHSISYSSLVFAYHGIGKRSISHQWHSQEAISGISKPYVALPINNTSKYAHACYSYP